MERGFKGVWIDREIWLDKDLTPLEKFIFAEIDSLDGVNGCTASNEYLAEFCQCSERKVKDAISKLKEKGMIQQVYFDGRKRTLKSLRQAKFAPLKGKFCTPEKKLHSNRIINIDYNRESAENSSFDTEEFFETAKRRSWKKK